MGLLFPLKLLLISYVLVNTSYGKANGKNAANGFNITVKLKNRSTVVNTNTFAVASNAQLEAVTQKDTDHIYVVKNIGRQQVRVGVRQGHAFGWAGYLIKTELPPGEGKLLDPKSKSHAYTQLVLLNKGDQRAIVQAYHEGGYPSYVDRSASFHLDIDINNLMKKLVTFGTDYIPMVGPVVSNVIDFFWPATSADAWEQVKEQVQSLLDSTISDLVENMLENKIRMYKRRMNAISLVQKKKIRKKRIASHYLNIAQDMIGLEEDFIFKPKQTGDYNKINYALLPLFSMVVSLKIMFYRCGIEDPAALGLDEEDIDELRLYGGLTLDPVDGVVIKHLNNVMEEREKHVYDTAPVENIFNEMTNVKNYVTFNGLKYLALWEDIIQGAPSYGFPVNTALHYGPFVGITTGHLLYQATTHPTFPALTPNIVNGNRPRLTKVEVHLLHLKVCGIKVIYEDGSEVPSGLLENTTETKSIDFGSDYLEKIMVWGDFPKGPISGLYFVTDGDDSHIVGSKTDDFQVLRMDGHHIAGIHISNDANKKEFAWNLAVSWQPDNYEHV